MNTLIANKTPEILKDPRNVLYKTQRMYVDIDYIKKLLT